MPTLKHRKRKLDQAFGVRVRYRIPEWGKLWRYSAMFEWLDANIGKGNYGHSSDTLPGIDALAFYFRNIKDAEAFKAAFKELEYAEFDSS